MKVLEVIRQGKIGGGESHLLDLIYYLDKEKYEPICLSFSDGEMIYRLRQDGVKCYILNSQKPFDISTYRKILSIIRNEGVRLVHAHGSRAASNILFPVLWSHVPFVYTVHGWSFHDDQSSIIKKVRAYSEKLICRYANDVICVSKSNAITGRDVFGLDDVHVIENGINLDRFNPYSDYKDLRKEFGFSDSDFIVGFIARCTFQKNPICFLEALRKIHSIDSKIKGLFVGEGEMDEEVCEFIYKNDMQSYLFKSTFRTDVPDLLNCIDVYCLPSLWEGLSIALLEAMAMKKCIVATPTDGTKELIENGKNGLIVSFNNCDEIKNAILKFYVDKRFSQECASAARQLVITRFNAQRVANSVSDIYMKYSL